MSKKVYGSGAGLVSPAPIAPGGEREKSVEGDVDINVNSWLNRKTKFLALLKHLKAAHGFDHRIFRRVTVARLPCGEQWLMDGDHSRALYKNQYPKAETIPATIVECKDYEEISLLFYLLNEGARTKMSAVASFIHRYHSGQFPEDQVIGKELKKSGLFVTLGLTGDHKGQTIGDTSDGAYSVRIKGFKAISKSLKDDKPSIYYASKLIRESFSDTKDNKKMAKELLWGLSTLISVMPVLRTNSKFSSALNEWLASQASVVCKQQVLSGNFKSAGGKVGNADALCVALGAYEGFRRWSESKGLISSSTFRKYCGSAAKNLKNRIEKS